MLRRGRFVSCHVLGRAGHGYNRRRRGALRNCGIVGGIASGYVGYLGATFLPVIPKTNYRIRRHPGLTASGLRHAPLRRKPGPIPFLIGYT